MSARPLAALRARRRGSPFELRGHRLVFLLCVLPTLHRCCPHHPTDYFLCSVSAWLRLGLTTAQAAPHCELFCRVTPSTNTSRAHHERFSPLLDRQYWQSVRRTVGAAGPPIPRWTYSQWGARVLLPKVVRPLGGTPLGSGMMAGTTGRQPDTGACALVAGAFDLVDRLIASVERLLDPCWRFHCGLCDWTL